MDIATSTISNIVAAGIPHAAQEARRDSNARETIPQISHTAQSLNSQNVAQGNAQTAPANSNLYAQADAFIRVGQEKNQNGKKEAKASKKDESADAKGVKGKAQASSTSTSSGASLEQGVNASGKSNAALAGSYGASESSTVAYSEDADNHRNKGEGFTSKVVAKTYNKIIPNHHLGLSINTMT